MRIDGPTEIVRAAVETGAHIHFCHINSSSRRHIDRVLALVEKCRAEGGRVTTEAYPYGSGSTSIGAAFLEPDLLPRLNITPRSIIYLQTGERLADAGRLRQLRAEDPSARVIIELLREDDPNERRFLDTAVLGKDTIIASDAMPLLQSGKPVDDAGWPLPTDTVTHPRTAGTFAKTLRRYVREDGTLELNEAIRRASTLPALTLQAASPQMRKKGRVEIGADADVIVFDPATVSDQATYDESCRTSTGFQHVVINGVPLIRNGELDLTVMPGRPIRAA